MVKLSVYQVDGLPEDAAFHIDYELAAEDGSTPITESLTQKVNSLPFPINHTVLFLIFLSLGS